MDQTNTVAVLTFPNSSWETRMAWKPGGPSAFNCRIPSGPEPGRHLFGDERRHTGANMAAEVSLQDHRGAPLHLYEPIIQGMVRGTEVGRNQEPMQPGACPIKAVDRAELTSSPVQHHLV